MIVAEASLVPAALAGGDSKTEFTTPGAIAGCNSVSRIKGACLKPHYIIKIHGSDL